MSDDIHSSATMMSWWLGDGEGPVAALPSWIAPRLLPHEGPPRPSIEPSSPPSHVLPSVAPPASSRLIASLRPPSHPHIALQEEPPPYPDLREENAALRRQLADMAVSIARFRRSVIESSEGEIVKLACAVAERVTRQELLTMPALIVGWVREAIEALGAKQDVFVAIAPDLALLLEPEVWSEVSRGSVVIETDPSLRSFQCEVRTRSASVDVSSEGRVAAVASALGVTTE